MIAATAHPRRVAADSLGNIYFAANDSIRRISASDGTITTYAGNYNLNSQQDTGDGGLATSATLSGACAIVFDNADNLYIGTRNSLRKVTASTGVISTVANGGPIGLAIDAAGNLYSTDGQIIFKIATGTGAQTIIAGLPLCQASHSMAIRETADRQLLPN